MGACNEPLDTSANATRMRLRNLKIQNRSEINKGKIMEMREKSASGLMNSSNQEKDSDLDPANFLIEDEPSIRQFTNDQVG